MDLCDMVGGQRLHVAGFFEGGGAALTRKAPHVHERVDGVLMKQRKQLLEGSRAVADGVDGVGCH